MAGESSGILETSIDIFMSFTGFVDRDGYKTHLANFLR